jgi:predicted nucleic acid-binding Zn ribbon protein
MKKSNTQPLKEVIQQYVEALKMKQKLKEVSLIGSWEKFVGKTIGRATRDIYIKDRKLYVILNSSVIRNELHNIKTPLMDKLNESLGTSVIDDIILK